MHDIPLYFVYNYTDVDRAFWETHLEAWLPQRVTDAHVHIVDPALQVHPITEEMRRTHWVMELHEMQDAETAERCIHTVFPGREIDCVAFPYPTLDWDVEAANEYIVREMRQRRWASLVLVRPQWSAERVAQLLELPGVLGVKPYFQLIGHDSGHRDRYLESSIFDLLPHHQLEVLNDRGAWVTMHVPRAGRLAHPDNLREVQEIRRRYPDIILVIAHLGRSYTLPHAREGLGPLADDLGLYFDCSAVMNPDVHLYAIQTLGAQRILYGSDNPMFYLRGRQQWRGTTYINRTNYPFHFNTEREAPEIEAQYTLYLYEALRALKWACERAELGREQVEALLHGNAQRLITRAANTGDRREADVKVQAQPSGEACAGA